jgi:hypothetical protein
MLMIYKPVMITEFMRPATCPTVVSTMLTLGGSLISLPVIRNLEDPTEKIILFMMKDFA